MYNVAVGGQPRQAHRRRDERGDKVAVLRQRSAYMSRIESRQIDDEGGMSASEAVNQHLSNSFFSATLADADPEIARAIALELGRQRDEIELIASENIVSQAVLEAQGSVMTNKYAEGYPRR